MHSTARSHYVENPIISSDIREDVSLNRNTSTSKVGSSYPIICIDIYLYATNLPLISYRHMLLQYPTLFVCQPASLPCSIPSPIALHTASARRSSYENFVTTVLYRDNHTVSHLLFANTKYFTVLYIRTVSGPEIGIIVTAPSKQSA